MSKANKVIIPVTVVDPKEVKSFNDDLSKLQVRFVDSLKGLVRFDKSITAVREEIALLFKAIPCNKGEKEGARLTAWKKFLSSVKIACDFKAMKKDDKGLFNSQLSKLRVKCGVSAQNAGGNKTETKADKSDDVSEKSDLVIPTPDKTPKARQSLVDRAMLALKLALGCDMPDLMEMVEDWSDRNNK